MSKLTALREIVLIVAIALVVWILVPVKMHESGWLKGFDDSLAKTQRTLGSVETAASTMNDAATEVLDVAGTANKVITHADRTLSKFDAVLAAAEVLEAHATIQIDELGTHSTKAIDSLDLAITHADRSATEALGAIPQTLFSAQRTFDSASQFMNGPLTQNSNALTSFLIPASLFASDVQQKEHSWLYPPDQSKWMKTYKFLRGVSPLAQPTYYGLRIYNGE